MPNWVAGLDYQIKRTAQAEKKKSNASNNFPES